MALHATSIVGAATQRVTAPWLLVPVFGLCATSAALAQCAQWGTQFGGPNGITGGSATVRTATVFDDGSGPALFVGGQFTAAGGVATAGLVRWDGQSWIAVLPPTAPNITYTTATLAVHDDGTGPRLWAAGAWQAHGYNGFIGSWNNGSWTGIIGPTTCGAPCGAGTLALLSHDDGSGPALFVAGEFIATGNPQVLASNIARWHAGVWTALGPAGGGLPGGGLNGGVNVLAEYDDGTGPALYAAGNFTAATSGVPTLRIAKWDGAAWAALGVPGTGPDATVHALAVFDDGSGPALYVGGAFNSTAGVAAAHVARWDGTSWSAVGSGTNGSVRTLAVFDDGAGAALHAGGDFTQAGGANASHIARWDGATWSALGSPVDGADGSVLAMCAYDDGADGDRDLHVGGAFNATGGVAAASLGEWHGCGALAFCLGDGSLAPCPCGNVGFPGHGCANSASVEGGLLSVSGRTSPDSLHLNASQLPPTTTAIFLKGDVDNGTGAVFGDGIRCVDGALIRLGQSAGSGGAATYPSSIQIPISVRGNTPPGSGLVAYYQTYYRNAAAAFCPPDTFNVTNGMRVVW